MRCHLTESWTEDHYVRLPGVETSCDLIERLPSHVRLAMSRGKDALSAWIHLRAHGKTVDPVFYWTVPGVPFEETDLARLEQHFGTKVRQISHPAYWRFMREELYQPPLAVALIRKLNIREPKWNEIHQWLDDDLGLGKLTVCSGPRAADSSLRRMSVIKSGPQPKSGAWVVWDWKINAVRRALAADQLELPSDYRMFKRSLDGISRQYMEPLSRMFPSSYAAIVEHFPLIPAVQKLPSIKELGL